MTAINYGAWPAAFAGQVADLAQASIRSFLNAEKSAEIPFGTGVIQGSAAGDALVPATVDDMFVGVAVHTHTAVASGSTGVAVAEEVSVMHRGRCWVVVGEAVSVGDRGWLSYDASCGGAVGRFMKASVDDKTLDTSAQVLFLSASSGGAGTFALAEIDCMNVQGTSPVTGSV